MQQDRNTMEEKILGFCHDTYLKIDVLLLTDIFGTFENTCLNHWKLDPGHFYTTPRLVWEILKAASKYFEFEAKRKDCELCLDEFRLHLLTDIDMLLLFEKGIQERITQAVIRFAEVSNR